MAAHAQLPPYRFTDFVKAENMQTRPGNLSAAAVAEAVPGARGSEGAAIFQNATEGSQPTAAAESHHLTRRECVGGVHRYPQR